MAMTGTPDGKLLAPAANVGPAAAQPASAPSAIPEHRQPLVVITLSSEIDTSDDGQAHDTLVLAGDIDEETYPALTEALNHIPRDNASLHVDLSAVTFCDLAGLRAIVRLADTTTPVMLHGVPRPLRTVIEILGWDQQPGLVISTCQDGMPAREVRVAGPPAISPAQRR
jgi:anti-anti-sigma regulatory factor